jgi:putative ABC transport system permease protein
MKTLSIAFRNIFRNARRSIMTVLAIGVSAVSTLLFGGFVFSIMYGLQTGIVRSTGHLQVYQKGFFDYGSGNPAAYGISHYEEVIRYIMEDPQLKKLVEVATPVLKIYGIAGNFAADTSKTFFGLGMIPSERERMRNWNDYGLKDTRPREPGLFDNDTEGGVVGNGMARMLQLCGALHLANCTDKAPDMAAAGAPAGEDFSSLIALDAEEKSKAPEDKRPKLDLLAATAAGAPNVLTLFVNKAEYQGVKELDDIFVAMHLSFAQRLLYGKGERKVTGIVLQLKHTSDIPVVTKRLAEIFSARNLDFEVKTFRELVPSYGQIISMFASIFTFLAMIMGVIVLFTIVNTMSMCVMERVNEIGTVRALGVRRNGVLRLFLTEGCLMGVMGATIGSLIAAVAAIIINASGITWTPPNYVEPVHLVVQVFQNPAFLPMTWLVLILLAVISSFIPARKAARMMIVDALRHV